MVACKTDLKLDTSSFLLKHRNRRVSFPLFLVGHICSFLVSSASSSPFPFSLPFSLNCFPFFYLFLFLLFFLIFLLPSYSINRTSRNDLSYSFTDRGKEFSRYTLILGVNWSVSLSNHKNCWISFLGFTYCFGGAAWSQTKIICIDNDNVDIIQQYLGIFQCLVSYTKYFTMSELKITNLYFYMCPCQMFVLTIHTHLRYI